MKTPLALSWALASALPLGAAGVSLARYVTARADAAAERMRLTTVTEHLGELARLRSSAPPWTRQGPPAGGLAPRVSGALAASGLPATALSTLSPEAESGMGEADLRARRTRAVLTLAPVTLPQLGAFLSEWRTQAPEWTVSSIDLSPQNERDTGAGGDLPLRAVLAIETLYVGGTGASR